MSDAVPVTEPTVKWSCELKPLVATDATVVQFTVGAKYSLKCSGPDILPFKNVPRLVFPQAEQAYSLSVLDMKTATANEAELVVTGYKPGHFAPEFIDIVDGQISVRTQGIEWTVASVIQPTKGEQPKPYGPLGPWKLAFPWWVWGSIAIAVILIIAAVVWRVRHALARKRLLQRLSVSSSALSPLNQFSKDMRFMLRHFHGRTKETEEARPIDYLAQLNKSFREYLTRELLVPADEWSDRLILRDIRKRHVRVHRDSGPELRAIFAELQRAKSAKALTFTDCEQLQEMSRKIVERIYRVKHEVQR